MPDKEEKNDLIISMTPNTEKLLQEGLLTTDIIAIRDTVDNLDPNKLDEYSDTLLYRAYFVAKKMCTNSPSVIAKELKISVRLLKYYLEKYPKLATVIQMGLMDATENIKTTVVQSLYKSAMGQMVTEHAVVKETEYDDEGVPLGTKEKISEVNKYIPPNTQAALELLRKLDPSWNPKVDINVAENKTLHVIEDVNVAVDYRKLSAQSLRELIQAQKTTGADMTVNQLESGECVETLNTYVPQPKGELTEEDKKRQKHLKSSNPPKKRIKKLTDAHNNTVEQVKKRAKKQALLALKENK